jgi:hypothetical protein
MIRWAMKALNATVAALLASLGLSAAPLAALLWSARIVSAIDRGGRSKVYAFAIADRRDRGPDIPAKLARGYPPTLDWRRALAAKGLSASGTRTRGPNSRPTLAFRRPKRRDNMSEG